MPHYFFDLTDDKIVHDFKGKQLRAGRGTRIDHIRDYQGDTFARAQFPTGRSL
jgi:hypothetical protein